MPPRDAKAERLKQIGALNPYPERVRAPWFQAGGFFDARARKPLILKNGNLGKVVGARGFEPPTLRSRTVRATKLRHAPSKVRGKC